MVRQIEQEKEFLVYYLIKENYRFEIVFLNHYMTKSLSEFVKQKIGRGDAVFGKRQIKMDYYWRINKKTKKKI